MSEHRSELETKAFEFVFSLTIVVWLLDLSNSIGSPYIAVGWFFTLLLVILFCINIQTIKDMKSKKDNDNLYVTKSSGISSIKADINLCLGIFILVIFNLIVHLTNNSGDIENYNAIHYKFIVVGIAWGFSSTLDGYINQRISKGKL